MPTCFTNLGSCLDTIVPRKFPSNKRISNMVYLFWRKNEIEDPELDKDSYPWIIWYLWKARNDKLFRGISRDPLELIRDAEGECHAWFATNSKTTYENTTLHQTMSGQALSLKNTCLVDGSWIAKARYSGYGWVWMDGSGKDQILGLRNRENCLSSLHSELKALSWAMEIMLQHTNC